MFYLETFLPIILLIPKSSWSRSDFDILSLKLTTEPHNHKIDSCSYV